MMSAAVLRCLRYLLIGLLSVGLVLLILWAVVMVPPLLIDTHDIKDPAKRLDEVNSLRTNLLGVLGGLAVVAGAVVGALNFRETSRQNRAVLEVQRRGQVTERFTRAIEQLGQRGDEKLDVRIGAAYALEQIAQDSAELHWPIMEVLTAYLREHAQADPDVDAPAETAETHPPADHQAIATVIGRRQCARDPVGQRLDPHKTNLCGVSWVEAQLERAILAEAHLETAELGQAHLAGAGLAEAHLEGAYLGRAHLEGARLVEAHLEGADLAGADLEGADLGRAHLAGADLREARGLTVEQLQEAIDPGLARLASDLTSRLANLAGTPGQSTTEPPLQTPGRPDSNKG